MQSMDNFNNNSFEQCQSSPYAAGDFRPVKFEHLAVIDKIHSAQVTAIKLEDMDRNGICAS